MKMPGPAILKEHVESGMTINQIAERYGANRGTARDTLARYGLSLPVLNRRHAPALRITRHPVRESITVKSDHILIMRETVSGENGGVSIRSFSLPRISMHIAALQERGL